MKISNLYFKYPTSKDEVLKNISFKPEEKIITGIIGPNGSGKTTFMKILSGLLVPDKYNEFDTVESDRVALILGENQLYTDLTGYENILYYLYLNKIKKNDDDIRKMLSKVGLLDKKDMLVGQFSTGMKQKLNLAKVLLSKKEVIILDEPTSGMDPLSKVEMNQLLKNISANGEYTILISSHSMKEVEDICDNILFLNQGNEIFYGSKEELFRKYQKGIVELHGDKDFIESVVKDLKIKGRKFYCHTQDLQSKLVINGNYDLDSTDAYSQIIQRRLNLEDVFFFETAGDYNV